MYLVLAEGCSTLVLECWCTIYLEVTVHRFHAPPKVKLPGVAHHCPARPSAESLAFTHDKTYQHEQEFHFN